KKADLMSASCSMCQHAGYRCQLSGLAGQGFDFGIQAALMTSSLVLVNQAFVSDAIDHFNSIYISRLCSSKIAGFNGINYFLQIGTPHRAHAGVVLASFFVLTRAFSSLG